jgi:hypothetical protein
MVKIIFAAGAACVLFAAGLVLTTAANAGGGSVSAVKRTNSALANSSRTPFAQAGRNRKTEITEFSSSSARRHRQRR